MCGCMLVPFSTHALDWLLQLCQCSHSPRYYRNKAQRVEKIVLPPTVPWDAGAEQDGHTMFLGPRTWKKRWRISCDSSARGVTKAFFSCSAFTRSGTLFISMMLMPRVLATR